MHGRRRHLFLILQSQLLEQAQHRRITPGHIPASRRTPACRAEPTQQQGAYPGAPPGGADKHQDPGRVSCPALIPRHTHHPPRRDGLGSRDDPRRITGPRDGHVIGTVGRQTSQAREPAPGGGIQAPPQRLDPRGVIAAQRPEHHHPAITQRLLPSQGAAGSHDPPQGRSWPGHAFTGPPSPAVPQRNAGRGACLARAGTPGDPLAPRLPGRAWHRLPQHPILPARGVDHDHHPVWTLISHGTTQPGPATRPGAVPRRPSQGKQSGLVAGKRRTSPRVRRRPARSQDSDAVRQMHATMSATSRRAHPEPGRSPSPSPTSMHAAARAPVPGAPGLDRPAARADGLHREDAAGPMCP